MEDGRRQPPNAAAAAISSVLGDDDLLREILLRLVFPTTLVRAALACKRWLRVASHPALLRRFRARHPPRLLGFYHTARMDEQPVFVRLPQPPELAVVLRGASFELAGGTSGTNSAMIFDCRNGRLLRVEFPPGGPRFGVVSPLHPARQPPALPLLDGRRLVRQRGGEVLHDSCMLLPEDGGDDRSCTFVVLIRKDMEFFAKAVSIKAGALDLDEVRTSASIQLPTFWPKNRKGGLHFHGNLYMLCTNDHIIGLNLTSMVLFLIKLPDGVKHLEFMKNLELLQAGDSGLYLVHLKGFQLNVWLRAADGNNGADWELVDTICLHQSFGQVAKPNWESGVPSAGDAFVSLRRVEDKAELFLSVDRTIFHIHITNRTAHKVYYKLTPNEDYVYDIYPFVMIWPPTFPALNYVLNQYE